MVGVKDREEGRGVSVRIRGGMSKGGVATRDDKRERREARRGEDAVGGRRRRGA